jgi:hypothetical protein
MLFGGVVLFVVLFAHIGRNNLRNFVEHRTLRPAVVSELEYTRGTVGFFELTGTIDFYSSFADVWVEYMRDGVEHRLLFTPSNTTDGMARMVVHVGNAQGIEYRRRAGEFERNGVLLPAAQGIIMLASDMSLPLDTFTTLRNIPGHGMAGYEFTTEMFLWAVDARFVVTVTQYVGAPAVETIVFRLVT